MPTQSELATQMIQQLRILDPSVSAEIGTPERKIIDTVAQAIAENSIDLDQLAGGLDLDAKTGSDLDNFLALFGFGRQQGVGATGYVTFGRTTASNFDIAIPQNTLVKAPNVTITGTESVVTDITFYTTQSVTLRAGDLTVIAPIRALIEGENSNLAAGLISTFGGTPVTGITTITNEVPTLNGIDAETDDELKIRFRNTVFRNVAGTNDQYLALAVATQFTTKANVVGPISRYREYVQVPDVNDATADPDSGYTGNGVSTEFTTALSTVPYSKYVYTTTPFFVSNGKSGTEVEYYIQDIDFYVNTTNIARDRGDTYRGRVAGTGGNVNTDASTAYQPNITFTNVYTGNDPLVQGIRPKNVVLFEHSYISTASRNDYARQVLNCVDVFINGSNLTLADATVSNPNFNNIFSTNSSSRYYVENFRRVGEYAHRPTIGNIFQPLFSQPVIALPDTIETTESIFYKGVHYWPVEDVSDIGGTVRARNGIEWAAAVAGHDDSGTFISPAVISIATQPIDVIGYQYDRNIPDLQASCEGAKQVTTDVLVHRATKRFFKLDVTVMYTAGYSASDVNTNVANAVKDYLGSLYFGTVVQLSDLIQTIHNVAGVDNVRWSKEVLSGLTDSAGNPRHRVVECDSYGKPLANVWVDYRTNIASAPCQQQIYLSGSPGGTDYYTLTYGATTSSNLLYSADYTAVQTALRTITGDASLTVASSGTGTPTNPFVATFSTNGTKSLITANAYFTAATTAYNTDFFLADNQLPYLPDEALSTDTSPGLIIRTRSQGTWNQL